MQSLNLDKTITAWSSIAENVFVPHTEEEFERLVHMLDSLIDQKKAEGRRQRAEGGKSYKGNK
jgi:hypothetical protein